MSRIFISYRRKDTQIAAGALARDLREHFGDTAVFRDKESIAGGEDWLQSIDHAIHSGAVMLVLIGPQWLDCADDQGRRLDMADDPIRNEILTALTHGLTVIPVLVEGGAIPRPEELPEVLRPLLRSHALKLRDDEWEHDLRKIIATLEKLGIPPKPWDPPHPIPPPPESAKTNRKAITGLTLVLFSFAAYSEEPDADTLLGALVFVIAGLVFGVLGYQEIKRQHKNKKGMAIAISTFAVGTLALLALLGSLGNLSTGGSPNFSPPPVAMNPAADLPSAPALNAQKIVTPPPDPKPRHPSPPAASSLDISGVWLSNTAEMLLIQQRGTAVEILAGDMANNGYMGRGQLQGTHLNLTVAHTGTGLSVVMDMEVSQDGTQMNGTLSQPLTGMTQPYQLARQTHAQQFSE